MMSADIRKKFGARIQALRAKRGLSQEKLAHIVGVHRTYMGFVERGERNPTLTKIEKIARALNIAIRELF